MKKMHLSFITREGLQAIRQTNTLKLLIAPLVCLTFFLGTAGAENDLASFDQWTALNGKTIADFHENRIEDAEKSAREALDFALKHLPQTSPELGSSYNNLGTMLQRLGKFEEARQAHLEALRVREKSVPLNKIDIANSLISVADAYFSEQNYAQAAQFFGRAVPILESEQVDSLYGQWGVAHSLYRLENKTSDQTNKALEAMLRLVEAYGRAPNPNPGAYDAALDAINNLARDTGRLGEVSDSAIALVSLRENAAEQDHSAIAWAYRFLAATLEAQRDYDAAEQAFHKGIYWAGARDGIYNQDTATLSYILGDMLADIGQFPEAERAFRQTLEIERKLYGDAHAETINSYNRLGLLLLDTGRSATAEGVLRRGLELAYQVHGNDSLWVATLADNLGLALSDTGNLKEAISLHRTALGIRDAHLGRINAGTSKTVNNLALSLERDGQYEEAQKFFREALKIDRETLPDGSWEIGVALTNLASTLLAMQTAAASSEAYFYYREALEISRLNYPASHPDIAASLDSLAMVANRAALHEDAIAYFREATTIYSAPQNRDRIADRAVIFDAAAASLLALSKANAAEAFALAQWPMQTAASKAIAASAQRTASGDPELSTLIRRTQDVQRLNAKLNEQFLASLGSVNDALRSKLKSDLEQSEQQLTELQAKLANRFPDFNQLQAGVPIGIDEVRAVLEPDEVLVFIRPGHTRLEGDEVAGSIFVVPAEGPVAAALLEVGNSLQKDAQALLCSVQGGVAGCPSASEASGLTRGAFTLGGEAAGALPKEAFNLALAHNLFERIFGDVESELRAARRLIIVPGSETLAALPFQLLVSEPVDTLVNAEEEAYRQARWLIKDWAITVLPNVSSLTYTRQRAVETDQERTIEFLGIGDPVIGSDTRIVCEDNAPNLQVASIDRAVSNAQTSELWLASKSQGRLSIADVDAVRQLTRLPDTRCELEQIAKSIGNGDLLLAHEANETLIKSMSDSGALLKYDIISFATHGLVAGEITNAEPALVLTPPEKGSVQDDGLLSATEISQLNLDAEWVLLSACNTATGRVTSGDGSEQSESFSGLARAFFYAGARNLLVSHWPVQSPAAVSLTTATFEALAQDPELDRSIAFQLAMLKILNDPASTKQMVHPRYWAPFTLLGNSP